MKVKIYGAGSIGNHLAQASRRMGWEVVVVDRDEKALKRMKEDIYPSRYGAWDETIRLYRLGTEPQSGFDAIFIGTPPDTHLPLAITILRTESPKVLQIEKPLCATTLEGLKEFLTEAQRCKNTKIVVGYNHTLADNTSKTIELLRREAIGTPLTIDAETRSHWSGIFKAHPWLAGPQDSYLGFWQRGGGASGEHSHALHLWQYFAHVVGAGRVVAVSASIDYVDAHGALYDRLCHLFLTTEHGLIGRVIQDVITTPKRKYAMIQGDTGRIEWYCDVTNTLDRVEVKGKEQQENFDIPKTRTDEFFKEIKHIDNLLTGATAYEDSPLQLKRGIETMLVLEAAHRSHAEGSKTIPVDYSLVDSF